MPPKQTFMRKRSETQSNTRTKCAPSSTSNKHTVHTTIQDSFENHNDSTLDPHSIPSTTDVVTITGNDRSYFRVSKQILQYELKLKRINVETLLDQVHLEGDEISLPTSIPSDWRLVSQDSITNDDLREGCISLFEQINSGIQLTPIEVVYASRFVEYTYLYIKNSPSSHAMLLQTVFPEEENCQTKLASALIKLVCHPSDRLRTVALSFFDVGLSKSAKKCTIAVAVTGLIPKLFEHLKPLEIPINETTIEFHRHITAIVDDFLSFSTPEDVCNHLNDHKSTLPQTPLVSEIIDPIFRPFCAYLRYLLDPPDGPIDYHFGLSLLSKMKLFKKHITEAFWPQSSFPELKQFFDELKTNMTEELASSLDLTTTAQALHRLLFRSGRDFDDPSWAETYQNILVRLSEGRQCSDLGAESFLCFLSNRPKLVEPKFWSDGSVSIDVNHSVESEFSLPSTSLGTVLTPTRPYFAAACLTLFRPISYHFRISTLWRDIECGWFAGMINALTPWQLPFTSEFIPLHKQLIDAMKIRLHLIRQVGFWDDDPKSRSKLNELYHYFHKNTKEYVVHLSLHLFAIPTQNNSNNSVILDEFFSNFFRPYHPPNMTNPFQDEVRKEMDAAALSSSSPPFLLTSELVCDLTDEEIINVVDRIVALIESDSPISDDTILRICAFHTNQLKSIYLPELFRKAGRSTEQCFHAFECLLSLPFVHIDHRHINYLLNQKPKTQQPTLDEWDDVDLTTVGMVMLTIDEEHIFFKHHLSKIITFAVDVLPQLSHCATRLSVSQLERLLTPSIDLLRKVYFHRFLPMYDERHQCETGFIHLCRLCEQRVIAECLSRMGFFSRLVSGIVDDSSSFNSKCVIDIFIRQKRYSGTAGTDKKTLRRIRRHFLEEGLQDVLDFLLVRKKDSFNIFNRIEHGMGMMPFFGANLSKDSN
ncbi:hypothetical protein BLNAU_9740 [Blattamonas nauphoetae]|uniref:Uncharacterized protein n=1 Tax=Blattamonas nauphoetae TaxID=2049346 RepID=A0ABQ9XV54_9EUKA|nr:hypothetical protein BLNAU_9740 [Blattamonas nauphoetae]